MIEKKFIQDECFDEINDTKNNIYKKLSSHDKFRLTINPTMDCNLRCWYCYEKHTEKGFMTTDMQDAVIQFVNRLMDDDGLKTLDLGFFGGEPLMKSKQIVLPLLNNIQKLCTAHNKKLNIHFTTNGVLMSKTFINSLFDIVRSADFQVAFDGDKNLHDNTKFLHNHNGTYNIVLKNINYAMHRGFKFNVRCNYTNENIESFINLVNDICSLPHFNKNLIRFSLQRVWQSTYNTESEKKVNSLGEYIIEHGIKTNIATKHVPDFCYADYVNSLVINYNGNIYKCTARDFNEENRIGVLNTDGKIKYNITKAKFYSQIHFFYECDTCNLLPLCRICVQARYDNHKSKHCFKNISEEDKQRQINNYFESHCKDLL